MKLRFVWVGKTKSAPIARLLEDYLQRIGKLARLSVDEIRDGNLIEKEGQQILERVDQDPLIVALDEHGRHFTSRELAQFIERRKVQGTRQMTFVVGGHAGLSQAVKGRANLIMALSSMTLTHEIARLVLVEQVYRALTIAEGIPYQK